MTQGHLINEDYIISKESSKTSVKWISQSGLLIKICIEDIEKLYKNFNIPFNFFLNKIKESDTVNENVLRAYRNYKISKQLESSGKRIYSDK